MILGVWSNFCQEKVKFLVMGQINENLVLKSIFDLKKDIHFDFEEKNNKLDKN